MRNIIFYRKLSADKERPAKFKFLVDGSLRLDEDGRNFQVGQFCLSQVFGSDEEIIARFCTPDPCIEANTGSAGCIRKCCPIGMELSSATFTCQPSSSTDAFDVQFRNELGESVDRNLSSYVIRYGVTPKCTHGFNAPGKSFDNDEPFYILLDARMYFPAYLYNHRFVSDYCVDMERSNGSDLVNQIVYNFVVNCTQPINHDYKNIITYRLLG